MSDKRPDEPDRPWWKSSTGIAALATVAAAVLAALVTGIFSVIDDDGGSSGTSAINAAQGTTTTAATVPPESATSEPASPTMVQASSPPIWRRGKIALAVNGDSAADLDVQDRVWAPSSGDWDIAVEYNSVDTQTVGWITSRKTIDYEACADKSTLVLPFNVQKGDLRAGLNLCVRTDRERLALLHVDRVTKDADGYLTVVGFTAIVWDKENP